MDFIFKEMLKTIPLWVQLLNLSLNWWPPDSLSPIRSATETPIYADQYTANQDRISFAQILGNVATCKRWRLN